jgi:ubiquinol-cytochrome c reductase cytochrome c1 subunit
MNTNNSGRTLLALLSVAFFAGTPALGWAAAAAECGEVKCDKVKIDLGDKPSLQNGARIFVNYCLSCHSAGYMRYNRMGHDLGISDELVQENLLFAADKVGDLMKAVMPVADAKLWFGVAPPDLTLEARARSPEWIYTYLRTFYRDDKSPSGWNNAVFQNVAMPHVLYEWQGDQRAVFKKDDHGVMHIDGFTVERPGTKPKAEFDQDMRDLTNFLVYLGEPAKLERRSLGIYVILFLIVLAVLTYRLKKAYWKDVE